MRIALKEKFTQHPKLGERLVKTGNKKLIEDSSKDDYWGGAIPGSKNMLGILLMELRDELKINEDFYP